MDISTTPALLDEHGLVHEKLMPFTTQEVIPLTTLLRQDCFLDAVWCGIKRAVIPEHLSELDRLGEKVKEKCVADLTPIAQNRSLVYASEYAERIIELARTAPFRAVPYAIAVKGATARELVQRQKEYGRKYERALSLHSRFASQAMILRQILQEAGTKGLPKKYRKNPLGIAGGLEKLARIVQRRLLNPVIAEATAAREETMKTAEADFNSFILHVLSN